MKKNRVLIVIIVCLLAVTAVLAVTHQVTRIQDVEGAVLVEIDGRSIEVRISEMSLVPVQGTMVNNKGESREINGQGILLADVLELAGVRVDEVSDVSVTSSDEYRVEVTGEELAIPDKAYLLIEEESARLMVFGDSGAKRNVKNVARITVELAR